MFCLQKIRIAVFFGGVSSEHEVSCMSAAYILRTLSHMEKYDVLPVGITKDGRWLLYRGPVDALPNGSWQNHEQNQTAILSPDRSHRGLLLPCENGHWDFLPIDLAFPVLHGKNGEDGTIQGLFQLADLPFVGCDTASSAACMDKVMTNVMLQHAGIPQARFTWIYDWEFTRHPEDCLDRIEAALPAYPYFVKPANAGSSVGVSRADNREQLRRGIRTAAKEDGKILVEEGIDGQEVECAVLGNEDTLASLPGEIAPSNEFYDYDAKYLSGASKLFIPAHIDDATSSLLREYAQKAYHAMGCTGLARVDFFVRKSDGAVLLNELNTLPGFTAISMYPKLMEACGIGGEALMERLIALALDRRNRHE